MLKAIADPVRRAILDELAERDDQTLFELCGRLITGRGLALSRQAVSKHIAVLREAGLVSVRVAGRTSIHHLHPGALQEARRWLDTIAKDDQS